jgi:pimeloyl-ACP methyl ester carboxylesterase
MNHRLHRWAQIWVLVLLLVSCGGNEPTSNGATPAGDELDGMIDRSGAPEMTAEEVSIAAADDLILIGTYYSRASEAPRPAVLLLHMLGSNRTVWEQIGLPGILVSNGYNVLALDMRGHGDTGGQQNWDKSPDDIQRAWEFLRQQPGIDGERTALIGASIGANEALLAAANEPTIRTVILLSPGLDYRGVTTEPAMSTYSDRPILLVASEDDAYSADSIRQLANLATGTAVLQLYENAGHGTAMFAAAPDLSDLIIEWLNTHLKS